jgi:hypothetical protein
MKFKVGDLVRCVPKGTAGSGKGAGYIPGSEFVIDHISEQSDPIYWPKCGSGVYQEDIELVENKPKQSIVKMTQNPKTNPAGS